MSKSEAEAHDMVSIRRSHDGSRIHQRAREFAAFVASQAPVSGEGLPEALLGAGSPPEQPGAPVWGMQPAAERLIARGALGDPPPLLRDPPFAGHMGHRRIRTGTLLHAFRRLFVRNSQETYSI